MRLIDGVRGSVIIDDTYNSSPIAVAAGLDMLAKLNVSGRRIVLLGDMMELGDFSVDEHKKVGEHAAQIADQFIAVGVRMRTAALAARAANGHCTNVETAQDVAEALTVLGDTVQNGDVVYVKGSQSMRMEKIVAKLMKNPAAATTELVRQETEWQDR
jgi:UDP-N-acetylmuramoyl-tripeptide--D-alanyl-D-alanine ligase